MTPLGDVSVRLLEVALQRLERGDVVNLTRALRAGGRLALVACDDLAPVRDALDRAGVVDAAAVATGS